MNHILLGMMLVCSACLGACGDDAGGGGVTDARSVPGDARGADAAEDARPEADMGADSDASMCEREAMPGCCFEDSDCDEDSRCVGAVCAEAGEGICKPRVVDGGGCWQDSDCAAGTPCIGEVVCPCGAACFAPDEPGRCEES